MATLALEMVAGSQYPFRLTVANDLTEIPEDLTLWEEFWCTAKENVTDEDEDAVFQLTLTDDDITLIDAVNGLIEITIADTVTVDDGVTRHLYIDVKGKDADGIHWALSQGRLTVLASTTRAT